MVFSAEGARAYVTGELDASLMTIDVAKGEVVRRTTIPGENVRPMGVVVTPDGKTLYVATGRGGSSLVSTRRRSRSLAKWRSVRVRGTSR